MSSYPQRVRESILPISIGDTLPSAFEEWSFTEETVHHGSPVETCKLCGQEGLRYHFEIGNQHTEKTLWVGSHCILQFNVAVLEDGRRLSPKDAAKRLAKLTQKMQQDSCVAALERLSKTEDNSILSRALDYFRKKKKLSPKLAYVVFWKLEQYRIDHQPSFFQVELRKQQHIEDLRDMPTTRVHTIWRALTPAQRQRAIELGHSVPPT